MQPLPPGLIAVALVAFAGCAERATPAVNPWLDLAIPVFCLPESDPLAPLVGCERGYHPSYPPGVSPTSAPCDRLDVQASPRSLISFGTVDLVARFANCWDVDLALHCGDVSWVVAPLRDARFLVQGNVSGLGPTCGKLSVPSGSVVELRARWSGGLPCHEGRSACDPVVGPHQVGVLATVAGLGRLFGSADFVTRSREDLPVS